MPSVRVREAAPAKVNLMLRVVGRRADGYHLLDTVMVPVTLADRLRVSIQAGKTQAATVRLTVRGATRGVPRGQRNLVTRAALAFMGAAKRGATVHIALDKRIPVASGLGGGSSDAAAVLRAFRRAWPGVLSAARVKGLALALGADVPFFLHPRAARARGVGERLRPFRGRLPRWMVIAVPPRGVSTAAAYAAFRLTSPQLHSKVAPFRYSVSRPVNDLELAVIPTRPDIGRLKSYFLEAGAEGALMSGSGSAVVGTFATRRRATEAARRVPGAAAVFIVQPFPAKAPGGPRIAGR